MIKRIGEFFRDLWGRICGIWSESYKTKIVQETLPNRLHKGTLYIVEEDGFEEQAALICPCGCGSLLQMNLLTDTRPCWRVTVHDDGTATLHPSVWRKIGCRSHFWFRRGRVQWCDNRLPDH